jgi:hypothetical protein
MRAQPSISRDLETSTAYGPTQPDWWTHATTGWVPANESAHRACVKIAAECQTFAGRRLQEDLHLLQELSCAKAPDEVWNAWSRFWQTAAEEYGAEYSTIAKLAASSNSVRHRCGRDSEPWTDDINAIQSRLTTPRRRPCTSTS